MSDTTLKEIGDFLNRLRMEQKLARFVLIYDTPEKEDKYVYTNAPSRDYIRGYLAEFLAEEMSDNIEEVLYDGVDFIPRSDEKGN
jgi:hypothetical protein